MYSPKAGLAQKKKRRSSQSGKRGSTVTHGVRYTSLPVRGVRTSRGRGSGPRGRGIRTQHPPSSTSGVVQSTENNPFLKGLPSTRDEAETNVGKEDVPSQPTISGNPFLSGLASKQPPPGYSESTSGDAPNRHPPPPTYDTFLDGSTQPPQAGNERTNISSFIAPGPDYEPSDDAKKPLNPFLAKSRFPKSQSHSTAPETRSIQVHTTIRSDGQQGETVGFDVPMSSLQASTMPHSAIKTTEQTHLPTYSETVAHGSQMMVNKPRAGGSTRAPLPQHANMTVLHVKGIPDEMNNSAVLRKHFSQYGHVKLLKCFPAKKFATVEYSNRQGAVLAKKAGKVISPDYEPVSIFWHASKATPAAAVPPGQGSKYSYTFPNQVHTFKSADDLQLPKKEPVAVKLPQRKKAVMPKNERAAQESLPKGLSVKENRNKASSKTSLWDRLGGIAEEAPSKQTKVTKTRSRNTDEDWSLLETIDGGDDEDEDEGVSEGQYFLSELGNKVTGDEMDTIARTADHSYFLRSLMQSDSRGGPTSNTQVHVNAGVQQIDSHQLYNIPIPGVSLLQPPGGNTASEYYDTLNARDQEIRKGMKKQTVLSEAIATVGTCPDMCPEKERYRREDTRRLSWFEIRRDCGPGKPKVNHSKAIKEYSGSAADKEEPLPHDLRPLSILQMTMDYLVNMIMDDCEERKADWYDFVWNRTRGIRKDITLQHLCTVESTEMTEKCARFHILCSHLLCEEDTMTFDPRMNNENLNKCLLSLKEFYRDLRNEKGVHCPNEAEFCCYDILLHLADGNVLNLVTQYSSSVCHSPEVTFAVNVALSLDSNNFVKFFKLVRAATFLSSCILHRYFDFVRTKALKVLNRTHTPAKRPTEFPLGDLSRMLAFENTEEAAEFCQLLNLVTSHKGTHVKFFRGAVIESEQAVDLRRSSYLVDSKNNKSFGEVVNGGPLPPLFNHTPFSSFSKEGKRIRETTLLPSQVTAPPPPQREPAYSEQDLVFVVDSVVREVVSVSVKEVVQECAREEQQLVKEVNDHVCLSLCDGFLTEVVGRECQEVVQSAVFEALEVKAVKDELAKVVIADAVESVVQSEVQEVVQSTYRECIMIADATDAAVTSVTCDLVEECLCECVRGVIEETVRQLKKERKERLESCKQQFLKQQAHKYWSRWCQVLKVREHVRQCASDIPPLPPLVTLAWQLDMLCPLEKRRRLEVTSSEGTATQLEESKKEREKRRQEFFAPIDLPSLLRDVFLAFHSPSPAQHNRTPHIYWKLTFIYPPRDDLAPTDVQNINWLRKKLQYSNPEVGPTSTTQSLPDQRIEQLSLCSTPLHSSQTVDGVWSGDVSRRVQIVVQGVCSGQRREGEGRDDVRGTSGVMLYIATPQTKSVDCESYASYVLDMLHVATEGQQSLSPKFPLLLVCSKWLEDNHLAAWITVMRALDAYCKQEDSCVSMVNCLKLDIPPHIPSTVINEEQLVCSGLQWLTEHSQPPPSLYHMPLKDYVDQGILDHFVPLVVSDGTAREKACLPSQHPAPLISLYNSVLEHLAGVASSDELVALDWPIPEFASLKFVHGTLPPVYWNSPSYLNQLHQCIISLCLPPPSRLPINWASLDWSQQCTDCLEYVSTVQLPVEDHSASVTLVSRVKALLHHHRHKFDCDKTNQSECTVPWAQVIFACIENILTHLDSELWASGFHDKVRDFTVPIPWLRAQAETSLATAAQLTHTNPQTTVRKRRRRHRSDPHVVSISMPSSQLPSATSTPRHSLGIVSAQSNVGVSPRTSLSVGVSPVHGPVDRTDSEKESLTKKLKSSLNREKVKSQRFEAQLQKWLSHSSPEENTAASYSTLTGIDTRPTRHSDSISKDSVGVFRGSAPLSLTEQLEELQKQIRSAKWQDKKDNVYLHALSTTT